ncbi:MAG: LysR family transcriptional regulator, partial [Bradyrhizobium sp.]|nr:LysR family transcriptional regulator [Bradyrhizobium sp.]
LSEWTPSYPGYCLYYPGRRHMAASLRAFVDLAKEMVFRNRAALAAEEEHVFPTHSSNDSGSG